MLLIYLIKDDNVSDCNFSGNSWHSAVNLGRYIDKPDLTQRCSSQGREYLYPLLVLEVTHNVMGFSDLSWF